MYKKKKKSEVYITLSVSASSKLIFNTTTGDNALGYETSESSFPAGIKTQQLINTTIYTDVGSKPARVSFGPPDSHILGLTSSSVSLLKHRQAARFL